MQLDQSPFHRSRSRPRSLSMLELLTDKLLAHASVHLPKFDRRLAGSNMQVQTIKEGSPSRYLR